MATSSNYGSPLAAQTNNPGAPIYEVVLTNGDTRYTADPNNQYVAEVIGRDTSLQEAAAGYTAATATMTNLLRSYGLEELIPYVDQWIVDDLSDAEIEAMFYDPSTPVGAVVDRIYPEIRILRDTKQAPMSIPQIQQYRTTAKQLYRAAGLPPGFYDEDKDFTPLIAGTNGKAGVSLAELQDRIDNAWTAVRMAPAEVRSELDRWYGISTDQELAMLLLDPNRDAESVKKIARAAGAAGGFVGSTFGSISQAEAERLAALGVGFGEARQGVGALDRSRELWDPVLGERRGVTFTRDEKLDAVFEQDVGVTDRVETVAAKRAAPFRGGGGVATNREGYAGLGSTSR